MPFIHGILLHQGTWTVNFLINKTTLLILVGLLVTIALGLLSNGVHHDDDLTHFMFARWAWTHPAYLVHHWGRAGFTLPMALVAGIGDRTTAWHLARMLSAIVTAAAVWLAADYGRRAKLPHCWAIVPLCYLQPLLLRLAYTTLTETFLAFYLMLAVWLAQREKYCRATLVFSMALLCRHEAVVLLPVWWGYLFLQRRESVRGRILAMALALWAPIAQNVLHFVAFGVWPISAFFAPSGSTEYIATSPTAYIPNIIWASTVAVVGLFAAGCTSLRNRALLLPAALVAVFAATHIVVKWLGVFASGGFARFMVGVAPLLAVVACSGLAAVAREISLRNHRRMRATPIVLITSAAALAACWVEARAGRIGLASISSSWLLYSSLLLLAMFITCLVIRGQRFRRIVAVAGLSFVIILSLAQFAMMTRPLRLQAEHLAVQELVRQLDELGLADRPILAANPWVAWFAGHVEAPNAHKDATMVATMPVGGLVVWDSIYSESDFHGLNATWLNESAGVLEVPELGHACDRIVLRVFEKVGPVTTTKPFQPYPAPMTLGRGRADWPFYDVEPPF